MSLFNKKFLINKALFAILCLGFTSGLPLALTSTTLQAWFTEAHIPLMTIGALSLLGLPYTLKFLWAPVMDHFSFPYLGKRRGWILLTQIGLVLSIFVIANMHPTTQATQMGIVALIIAFFSASQDISITAYQTDVLQEKERGLGVAYYIFAYRIALLLSSGLALVFADYFGFKLTYDVMAALMLGMMLATYAAPHPNEAASVGANVFQTTWAAILDFLQRDKIFYILLFIMFYKFGDALALSLITNFLLHGLGFSLTEVGLAFKVVGFVAIVLGAFVGGLFLTRLNIFHALLFFGLAQAFSNLMFVILAVTGKNFSLMTTTVFIESFCSGLSTAALLAFMMSLCNHRYTASQFALLSAFASLGRVFLGPVAALMVEHLGWAQFYSWSVVLCFPGILCLLMLKNEVLGDESYAAN